MTVQTILASTCHWEQWTSHLKVDEPEIAYNQVGILKIFMKLILITCPAKELSHEQSLPPDIAIMIVGIIFPVS